MQHSRGEQAGLSRTFALAAIQSQGLDIHSTSLAPVLADLAVDQL